MKFEHFDFTPHQPYLEKNTVYYSYKPGFDDPLCGVVWEAYQVDKFDINKSMAFPDICADLMVFYTKDNTYCYLLSGTSGMRAMTSDLAFMKDVDTIFGVKFCSGTLGNLFRDLIHDAGEEIVPGQDALLGGRDIVAELRCASTFSARWAIIKKYLLKRMGLDYDFDALVKYATNRIIISHGKLRIQELEEETGYSNRYLRQRFNDHLGMSMKRFCQITQFQWSYHLYQQREGKLSLADLAILSGYYDQSHMNANYKKLTGLLPKNAVTLYQNDDDDSQPDGQNPILK